MSRASIRKVQVALVLVLALGAQAAFGFWSTSSLTGGNGYAAATSVNQGATPTAVANGRSVVVSWAATTMSNGDAVAGYTVQRYDVATGTQQSVNAGCTGTLSATTCTETRVPAGTWAYSVVPRLASNWRGTESTRSSPVTVATPKVTLTVSAAKPGATVSGQAEGFLSGDTLRFRLDSATGTDLTGTLAGNATPATVPASGAGAVTITLPAVLTEGTHTVYAVTSGGDVGTVEILVDSTPPAAPVLTSTPAAVSGDSVTFAYTLAEATATDECRLDTAAFAACDSPVDYTGLAVGAHTFQVRATDSVGNVSTVTSYAWTVNLTVPTVSTTHPIAGGLYNDAGFNAACGTVSTGDVCGTADDDQAVTAVAVSLKRSSTGLYWNGTAFAALTETFNAASGTTSWSYPIASSALPDGEYTVRARASDGSNLGYDSRTFTIDKTAPPTPTLSSTPAATSGPSASFAFTDGDATATFECRLDAGTWSSCSSPKLYAGLATGSHTVNVRAVDPAGNTSAATTTTWTVDATAPTASMTFPTATVHSLAGWNAGCSTPAGDICGTASDSGGSGLFDVTVSIRRQSTASYWDGSSFGASSETWISASGTSAWTLAFAGASFPGDGTYVVRYRATDNVGNTTTSSVTLTVDTTPPAAPRIDRSPSNPSAGSAVFEFSDADVVASYECRMDAAAWAACTSPKSYTGLVAGSHTFSVRALDAAGNVGDPTSYTWAVNTGLPEVDVTSLSAGSFLTDAAYSAGCGTPADDVCGTASDPDGAVLSVGVSIQQTSTGLYWNGSAFASSSETYLAASGTTTWTFPMPVSGFPEGSYTVTALATDNVGLTSTDSVAVTFDRTAPAAPTITSGPSGTTAGNDSFTFTGEAGATFQCRTDAGSWATCTSPRALGTLADGAHSFDVRAVDRAGNVGAATSRSWTVDATGPTIGFTFPGTPGVRLGNTRYNAGCGTTTVGDLCGTATDAAGTVTKTEISLQRAGTGLWLSGGTTFSASSQTWYTMTSPTSWTYAITYSRYTVDDTYVLWVRSTDSVGNVSTSSRSFVMDRVKPTGVGVSASNVGTVRKLEAGDSWTVTWSEAIDPSTIVAGWNGTGTQNVVVRGANGTTTADKLTVYNATNSATLPLGTLSLVRSDYLSGTSTFGATGTPSTISMNATGTSVTITLGTPSNLTYTTVAAAAVNLIWTPSSAAWDLAGNLTATTAYTENDNDDDF